MRSYPPSITCYAQAAAYMSGARDPKKGRPLGGHGGSTRLEFAENGKDLCVVLHKTPVVTFHEDSTITLRTNNWRTVTTKERINAHNRFGYVYSRDGVWFLESRADGGEHTEYLFTEGMRLHPDGRVTVNGSPARTSEEAREKIGEQRQLRRRVAQYARDFATAVLAGKIGMPSASDCWYCCMRNEKTGKPLGEEFRDSDHIRLHVDEKYFVPSLLYNAVHALGASQAMKHVIAYKCGQEGVPHPGSWFLEHATRNLAPLIRRYCLRELGMSY